MKRWLFILFLFPVLLVAQDTVYIEDSAYVYNAGGDAGTAFFSEMNKVNIWRKNTMLTNSDGGTMMSIGRDNPDADTGSINGSWVMGNYLENTAGEELSLHGIMDGYHAIGYKHNKTVDLPLSLVTEGCVTTEHDSTTPTMYNIFKVNYVYGLTNEGQKGKQYFNNTIISMGHLIGYAVHFSHNIEAPSDPWATDIEFKNNLIYCSTNDTIVLFLGEGSKATFDADYNVYWCENTVDNKPWFYVQGEVSNPIHYDDWQSLGYDTNSTIIDPDFIDTIDFIPSARLDYGTNLGSFYDVGLDTSYSYIAGLYPDTIEQNGDWQVGAVLYGPNSSHIYHLDPDGNDSYSGQTQDSAWATLQKALSTLEAGDTLWIHSGTYTPTTWYGATHDVFHLNPTGWIDSIQGTPVGNSGKIDSIICYMGAPGEDRPVFDFSDPGIDPNWDIPNDTFGNVGIYLAAAEYITFKDIIFDGLQKSLKEGPIVNMIQADASSNLRFENLSFNNIGGAGIRSFGGIGGVGSEFYADWGYECLIDSMYIINCDFDSCQDVNGNHGDAIKLDQDTGTYLYVYGNRSTFSADDAYDCSGNWERVFINNYAFAAGCVPNGNGIGIKSGAVRDSIEEIRGVVAYNFAAFCHTYETPEQSANNGFGFQTVDYRVGEEDYYYKANFRFYNNTAYRNDNNYGIASDVDWKPWSLNKYYNNVSLAPRYYQDRWRHSLILEDYIESNNTWYNDGEPYYNAYPNSSFTCDSSDFDPQSLDSAYILNQLYLPRESDGTLPNMNIMKLISGSDLIDAGTTTGYSEIVDIPGVPSQIINGSAPDIGAFEYEEENPRYKASRSSNGYFMIGANGKPQKFLEE